MLSNTLSCSPAEVDHGAHEQRVAGVVAVHPPRGVAQDPGLSVVILESRIVPVGDHLAVGAEHVLRRKVFHLEGHQLLVAESPLSDEEVDVRIRRRRRR